MSDGKTPEPEYRRGMRHALEILEAIPGANDVAIDAIREALCDPEMESMESDEQEARAARPSGERAAGRREGLEEAAGICGNIVGPYGEVVSRIPELLPCPKGHKEATIAETDDLAAEATCDTCGWYAYAPTAKEAAELWNDRPTQPSDLRPGTRESTPEPAAGEGRGRKGGG